MATDDVRERRERAVFLDLGAVVLVLAAAGVVFSVTRAPVYNRPNAIDPWLYTAAFVNFDYVHQFFGSTYYVSRLPWIIPGLATHAIFEPHVAHLVLHFVFFAAGVGAAFVIVRRLGSRSAAFAAAALLGLSQMYYNAHYTDYVDGAVITFILIGGALLLTRRAGIWRWVALAGAGFAFAAAVGTYLLAPIFFVGLVVPYLLVAPSLRRVALDAVALVGGAASLLVVCGTFSLAHDGPFWFIGPQIEFARNASASAYSLKGWSWVHSSSRLIAFGLTAAVSIIVLAFLVLRGGLRRSAERMVIGLLAYFVTTISVVFLWDLAAGGNVLEYTYSADLLLPAVVVGLGAILAALVEDRPRAAALALLPLVPTLAIYVDDRPGLTGKNVFVPILLAACTAAAVAWIAIARGGRALALFAAAAIVATTASALDADADVYRDGVSTNSGRISYELGLKVVRFLHRSGIQDDRPFFWYSTRDSPHFIDVQSMYFYSYTYLGLGMPKIDADFRFRVRTYRPTEIVFLCVSRSCHRADSALERAGFRVRLKGMKVIRASHRTVWIKAYDVARLPPGT
jgi:hypothetical protein